MEWNVYFENCNQKEIEIRNVFNLSVQFDKGLKALKKKKKDMTKEEFFEQLRKEAMYAFWGKREYEVAVVELFCMINNKELDRLIAERDSSTWGHSVNIETHRKVSVYDQLCLNWDIFANYVWENL